MSPGEIESAAKSKVKKMSVEIGFHIQEEIIKRLPVKSIVQFRSVCKSWKCLIDSSYFIAAHNQTVKDQDQRRHLLVSYLVGAQQRFVSIVDDESFPQQRFVPTLPLSIKLLQRSSIVGSCNGLLCVHGSYYDLESRFRNPLAVLWNPSIRKSITIVVPGVSHVMDQTALGFGVSPVTNDPMIVRVIQFAPLHEKKTNEINDPWDVMVYSLNSGKWRRPSTNVPSKSIRLKWCSVVIDRFIYWSGSQRMAKENLAQWIWTCNLIMSFDMTNDTFEVIYLPDCLAHYGRPRQVSISKLRESLVMLVEDSLFCCDVWMMENNGVERLFTKLFTIKKPVELGSIRALGFRKNGAPIVEVKDYSYEESEFVVYEPNSQHNLDDLQICGGARYVFPVDSYMETLLLLGRLDCTSY